MATNAVIEMTEKNRTLQDQIVSKIVEMGCACPTDLATQIGGGKKADDLINVLESLVKSGILRHKEDTSDQRQYADKYQTVYELKR